ncbi:MAG: AAA family ATPase [Bacteroidales bacterium]|nr:AAA family ATPase [Bacteroidales bacterium]
MKKIREQSHLKKTGTKRIGIALNRKDLLSLPVSSAKNIWHHQFVREIDRKSNSQTTSNIRIAITVEGFWSGKKWSGALEFDYANPESIYCRPLRIDEEGQNRHEIDEIAYNQGIAYLQPMSGLATREDKLTPGSIDVRIGEGKTADVLRNICYQLINPERDKGIDKDVSGKRWMKLKDIIFQKFGISINMPVFIPETGIIEMSYEENGHVYDLSSGGRGFQQTLLLLGYLFSYPGMTLLLDEPDAHLEVIRQRETYELINEIAGSLNSQLIIASHSEVVLNQAGGQDTVVALFDENCILLNSRQVLSQFRKILTETGWDKYYLAKLKGHIVFLEGSTDLKILVAFARKLKHPVQEMLEKSNIQFTSGNKTGIAVNFFYSLKNILPDLYGIAIFDRLEQIPDEAQDLKILQWKKKEIENYFAKPEVLLRWAENQGEVNLFYNPVEIMDKCIKENTAPANLKNRNSSWWDDNKMSDDYLFQIFNQFYEELNIPQELYKGQYYSLVDFMEISEIDSEITEKLDTIHDILIKQV